MNSIFQSYHFTKSEVLTTDHWIQVPRWSALKNIQIVSMSGWKGYLQCFVLFCSMASGLRLTFYTGILNVCITEAPCVIMVALLFKYIWNIPRHLLHFIHYISRANSRSSTLLPSVSKFINLSRADSILQYRTRNDVSFSTKYVLSCNDVIADALQYLSL